jgi:hypothetical protein
MRNKYQGLMNIIRFNWHLFVIAFVALLILGCLLLFITGPFAWLCVLLAITIVSSTTVSLGVSHFVYDRCSLYDFKWMDRIFSCPSKILNFHAGFDETSAIIRAKFPASEMMVFDFYDPHKHTELSIERARRLYPAFDGTIKIGTSAIPVEPASSDLTLNIFSLHEIRDDEERIEFLKLQAAALTESGYCVIVEHLRDLPNVLAYNVGSFHFFSEKVWIKNFAMAGLHLATKLKVTPFVTVFILTKGYGDTP